MRRNSVWGLTLVLGALLPSACGQVLGLKDFKDQPEGAQGGSSAGGAASSSKGGAASTQGGGASAGNVSTNGGSSDAGSGGVEEPGSGGTAPGAGGSPLGAGGTAPGAGGSPLGSGGAPPGSGGTAGAANGSGGVGGSAQLSCASDGQIIELLGPPDLDVSGSSAGTSSDIDEESLVVVADSGRLHVGIQRSDGQYVARSLSDGGGAQQPQVMVWTKNTGDNHRFTRGRVRLGKLEFFGMVHDSIAVLQVPVNSQGIAPGPSNSAVVETLVRKPCASDMVPASFGVSFHGNDYSLAVTCDGQMLRSLQVYESQEDKLSEIDSGDLSDSTLRVQDYVYVPGSPLIQVGDGGTAMLRLGVPQVGSGVSSAPFTLDFGTGLAALFGITENATQTGAEVLVASLSNPGLVPARVLWANVTADKYSDMAIPDPPGFSEVGTFRAVSEVGEPGQPTAGDWGMWMIGHSKTDANVMNQSPQVMRGTWVGPQGATLVFNQTLHTVQPGEVLRRAYAVRVGLASTFVVWLENVPDPTDVSDPTPKRHRLRAQRFTCAAAQ